MGLLANLFGGAQAAGTVVKDVGSAVGGLAKDLRTAITGVDPTLQGELEKIALQAEGIQAQAQTEVAKIEAASPRFFIAGARPALLWVFVLVILNHYVLAPYLQSFGLSVPALDVTELWPVLLGILGLGGMRSWEKIRGAQGNH